MKALPTLKFECFFEPRLYVQGDDLERLFTIFQGQKISGQFKLRARRRREYWSIQLPTGTFLDEFRPGVADYAADVAARDALIQTIRSAYNHRQFRSGRAIVEDDGTLYYHQELINLFAKHAEQPAFFRALNAFLKAAVAKPELIKGSTADARPFVPPAERGKTLGQTRRGPGWSLEEDQVLRQWFGVRTVGDLAGQHAKLTPDEWDRVLAALGGRRTPASVRKRISILNAQLAREMSVNGVVPRDRLREYMARVLGERPWRPRTEAAAPRSRAPRRRRAPASTEVVAN